MSIATKTSPQDIAVGRWPGILSSVGLSRILTKKHQPCPMCDGVDRFRFDDKEGRGTFFCSQCGAGDGFELLQRALGWDFKQAMAEVRKIIGAGVAPAGAPTKEPTVEQKMMGVRRLWREGQRIVKGDPVWRYIDRRLGVDATTLGSALRYHKAVRYEDGSRHPGMLAILQDVHGVAVSIHRTYLTEDGQKAAVDNPKRLMPGKPINGAAIRIGVGNGEEIGIAEGIETAIAAAKRFRLGQVWSAVSAVGLKSFEAPAGTLSVSIFADNDENCIGQAAGYSLAARLNHAGIRAGVLHPAKPGTDWADDLDAEVQS